MTHEAWAKDNDEKAIRETIRRTIAKAIKDRTKN